jgi:alkanesulfonate monooxygenase
MARGTTDSIWHHEISKVADTHDDGPGDVYWLYPLKNYKTFCPYLVGSYEEVGDYLRAYEKLGFATLILDEPQDHDDLVHTLQALRTIREPAGTEPR